MARHDDVVQRHKRSLARTEAALAAERKETRRIVLGMVIEASERALEALAFLPAPAVYTRRILWAQLRAWDKQIKELSDE